MLKSNWIFVLFFALVNSNLLAQEVNYSEYNWYFGNSASAIIFNKSDARAQLDDLQTTPYGIGGGAVISDPVTGDLIFYTDGERIYDANHEALPGNPLLLGNASINNSAVVFPFPYSTGQYYIFTNSGTSGANEIRVTHLDRNLPGNGNAGEPPMGDTLSLNGTTGLTDPSEAMIIIRQDIDNYWLITQNATSLEYRVTAINSTTGLGIPTSYAISTVAEPAYEAASFAYDSINNRLAVAPREANRNVYIMGFDMNTGVLSFDRSILNTGNTDGAGESIYDLEWSSTGNQLYISRFGGTGEFGDLYQFDFNDSVETVNSILAQPVFRSFGLQLAPDQNIYHLYQQTSGDLIEIGVITEADSTFHGDSLFFNVGYDSLAFEPSSIEARQFPSFAAPHFEMFDTLGFVYFDTCTTQTTKFMSIVEPTPESYLWDFGGDTINGPAPVYTFADAGVYLVTLSVTLNGIEEVYSQNITIIENDLTIDLGMDTVRCPGEVFTYDAGDGGLSYAWNTGDTTQTIQVDTTGVFSVAVETPGGCLNYAYVQVVTYEDDSQFRNQWYFGQQAGIDFNNPAGTVAITDDNLMDSPEAASSVSDLNGDLLFYTNGVTVWNKDHEIMSNGSNIGGDSTSTQGVMIVPLPGDTTTYYIFTTDPVYGDNTYDMRYSVVDMRRDRMRGAVVEKGLPFFTNSTERMTGLGIGAGASWLITHEFGNSQFKSYLLGAGGIQEPITSAVGSVLRWDEEKNATAELQVAQTGDYIAMAIQDSVENYVELFEIDSLGGAITQIAKIDIEEPAPALIYGVEFSSGAERLYITTNSNGSKLIQYDLDSIDAPTAESDIMSTKFEIASSASLEYGALQTGSDGVIYMAIDGQTSIGTINSPTSDDNESGFVEDGMDLEGRVSGLGLPNFVQSEPLPSTDPGMAYQNACLGQETIFDGTGTSIIDEYFWTFGDGTSADVEDTSHVYNLSGTYNVSFQVTNRCGLDTTFLEAIEVFAIPSEPTLEDSYALCNGPVTLEAWPVDTAAFTYTWSTGETTRQIEVSQNSLISVFITDTTGCQSDPDEALVDDTSPIVNLGPDQFVCQNDAFGPLESNNPGSTYTWSIDDIPNGNTLNQQTVDTSVPGVYIYSLEVVDLFDCRSSDEVEITVQTIPEFTFNPTPTSGCGATDGALNIDVLESGSFTYEMSGPVSLVPTAIDGPSGDTQIANNLSGGGYTITVTNILSGCANPQLATVEDGGTFTLDVTPVPGCPAEGELQVTVNAPISVSVDYELFDQVGASIFSSGATLDAANQFVISDLDSGTYSLVVQGFDGSNLCTGTLDSIVLPGDDLADFLIEPQFICGAEGQIGILPVTVNASDPVLYSWTGPDPGIIGSAQGDSIVVGAAGSYFVTASGTGLCDYTQEVIVTQNDLPDVQIDVLGSECDGVLTLDANITSTLVGNSGYQWSTGALSSQIDVTNSGSYEVTVLDQGTGCINSADIAVNVFDEVTVFLFAEPNCDEDGEIFLNAFSSIAEDVTFSWTNNGQALENNGAELVVTESGNYEVNVVSNSSGCDATASMNVNVTTIAEDQLLLTPSESFCSLDPNAENGQVALDPGSFSSYEWNIINTTEILSTDRIFIVQEPGVYEVTVSDGFTCVRDIVEVFDNCAPLIYAPNAFAPNGVNRTFFVYPNDYVTDFEIKIYSRWGELVYYSTDIDFEWDGFYRGILLQMGTYAYIMSYKSELQPERGRVYQRGGVMLVR